MRRRPPAPAALPAGVPEELATGPMISRWASPAKLAALSNWPEPDTPWADDSELLAAWNDARHRFRRAVRCWAHDAGLTERQALERLPDAARVRPWWDAGEAPRVGYSTDPRIEAAA